MIWFTVALGSAALALAAPSASPQETAEGQRLGECLVQKSTGADRIAVARWMVAALASAPQAADVATPQPGKKEAADRAMAALFTRLVAKDCAAEAKVVFASEDGIQAGFREAGEALGRVAMDELLRNPSAAEALADYTKFLKQEEFAPVLPKKQRPGG